MSSNKSMNVVPTHLHFGWGYRVLEFKLSRKVDSTRWAVAVTVASYITTFDLAGLFLWYCIKCKVYDTGKLEMRQQLLQQIMKLLLQ